MTLPYFRSEIILIGIFVCVCVSYICLKEEEIPVRSWEYCDSLTGIPSSTFTKVLKLLQYP